MSGPIPNLQFQPYNPMDTMIQTALGVYGAGVQGQNTKSNTAMNNAKLPYVGPTMEAQLAQLEMANKYYPQLTQAQISSLYSQNAKREADIEIDQQMLRNLGMMGGGGAMSTGAGMPGMMASPVNFGGQEEQIPQTSMGQPTPPIGMEPESMPGQENIPAFLQGAPKSMMQPGASMNMGGMPQQAPMELGLPSYAEQAARKRFRLPEYSAQEELAMKLALAKQNKLMEKEIETNFGTTGHLTTNQAQALGIENTIPILDKLIDFDVPNQQSLLPVFGKNAPQNVNSQANYESMVSNITDKLVAAWALPKNENSFETIENLVRKKPYESEGNYRERLEDLKSELVDIYGKVGVKKLPETQTTYSRNKAEKNQKVQMMAPDGTIRLIPSDKVNAAEAAGGRRV